MKEKIISAFIEQNLADIHKLMSLSRKTVGINAKQDLDAYMTQMVKKHQTILSDISTTDANQSNNVAFQAFKNELISSYRLLKRSPQPLGNPVDPQTILISINKSMQHLSHLIEQLLTDKYSAVTNGYSPTFLTSEQQWHHDLPMAGEKEIRFAIIKYALRYKVIENNRVVNEGTITTEPEGDGDLLLNSIDDLMPMLPILVTELIQKQHLKPYPVTEKPLIASWMKRAELLILALNSQAFITLSLLDMYFDKEQINAFIMIHRLNEMALLFNRLVKTYKDMQPYRLILKRDMQGCATLQTDYPAFLLDGQTPIDIKMSDGKPCVVMVENKNNYKMACIAYVSSLFEQEILVSEDKALFNMTHIKRRLSKSIPLHFGLDSLSNSFEDFCKRSKVRGYFHALASLDYLALITYCSHDEDVNVRNDKQEHALHLLHHHLLHAPEISPQFLPILELLLAKGLNTLVKLNNQKTIQQELAYLLTRKTMTYGLFFRENSKRDIYLAARHLLQPECIRKQRDINVLTTLSQNSTECLSDRQLNIAQVAFTLLCVSALIKIPGSPTLQLASSVYLLFLLTKMVLEEEDMLDLEDYMNPMKSY